MLRPICLLTLFIPPRLRYLSWSDISRKVG